MPRSSNPFRKRPQSWDLDMALSIARCAKGMNAKLNGVPPQHINRLMRAVLEDAGYIKRRTTTTTRRNTSRSRRQT